MLEFQALPQPGPSSVPLLRLTGSPETPRQTWLMEYRGTGIDAVSRARNFAGIGYLDSAEATQLLDRNGDALDLATGHLAGTLVCSRGSQPLPLYFFHVCPTLPANVEVALHVLSDPVPADEWLFVPQTTTTNARIYTRNPHFFTATFQAPGFSLSQMLTLSPVLPGWTWPTAAPGPDFVQAQALSGRLAGIVSAGSQTPLLDITSSEDGVTRTVQITSSALQLRENGLLRLDTSLNQTLGELLVALRKISGVQATPRAPLWVALGTASKSYVPVQAQTALTGQPVTLPLRGVFFSSFLKEPFMVNLSGSSSETPWRLTVASGQFQTWEPLSPRQRDIVNRQLMLLGTAGSAIAGSECKAQWVASAGSPAAGQQLDTGVLTDLPTTAIYPHGQSSALETLTPLSSDGRSYRSSRTGLAPQPVLEAWVGDQRFTPEALFESIDHVNGQFHTRFRTAQPPSIRYLYYEDTLDYTGFLHPIEGRWKPLEMNPRLQTTAERYHSLMLVLLPSQLSIPLSNEVFLDVRNPAPLRFLWTQDPLRSEQTLGQHELTAVPYHESLLPFPYRVLAVLHYHPDWSGLQLEDARRTGGDLRPGIDLGALDPALRNWELLTRRHGHQFNQTLILRIPRETLTRYTEEDIRRRCQRVLPAATFAEILYYDS